MGLRSHSTMDIRIVYLGSTRLLIPVSVLPENTTLGLFAPAGAALSHDRPTLPVDLRFISNDITTPLTPDELLVMLTNAYPHIPPPILARSWFEGAPFLGRAPTNWPAGTYHFPPMGETPPISVLPSSALVTAPFLTSLNQFTLSSLQPTTNMPLLQRVSAATGVNPFLDTASNLQVSAQPILPPPDLSEESVSAFFRPDVGVGLQWEQLVSDPHRSAAGALLMEDTANVALHLDTGAPTTSSTTPATVIASDPTTQSSTRPVSPGLAASVSGPRVQTESHHQARPHKRSHASSRDSKRSKKLKKPSTTALSQAAASGGSGRSQAAPADAPSSDPMLSSAPSRRPSSQHLTGTPDPDPASPGSRAPVTISSESEGSSHDVIPDEPRGNNSRH